MVGEMIEGGGLMYGAQAKSFITKMRNFPLKEFEAWWLKNYFVVGGAHVLEFLDKTPELVIDLNEITRVEGGNNGG